MAGAIYEKKPEDITKDERFVGKQTVLGCGYGMGATRFQVQLSNFGVTLDEEECQRIIDIYRDTYVEIPQLWREANNCLDEIIEDKETTFGKNDILKVQGRKGIELPNGLYVRYPNLREEYNKETKYTEMLYDTKKGRTVIPTRLYGGKVIENVCQALARIVIGEQLLRVAKKYKVVMTVHDAIGCVVPEGEVKQAMKFVEDSMRVRPKWAQDLPLDCEGGFGNSYGEC